MGKLFNILAFLLLVLFIAGIGWLGVESFKFMKDQPSENATALADSEIGNSVKDRAVFDSEEPDEWDDMDEEDEMDEVDSAVEESDKNEEEEEMDDVEEGEDLLEDEKDKETFTEKGISAKKPAPSPKEEKIKAPAKSKKKIARPKSDKKIVTPKNDTPAEYNKVVNMSPGGAFLVIAGSFTIAENAEKEVANLRKKGYSNAETVQFASTKYLSVCTGRFKTEKEAKGMAAKLKKDLKIDAYVHRRRIK